MDKQRKPLLALSLDELKQIVQEMSMPSFTAKQIADWLYKKRVTSIAEMTNLSLANRTKLGEVYEVGCYKPIQTTLSKDGTKKYLFEVNGGFVESVMIPDGERCTLCVSTQVGCKMGCRFCATGKQGFHGQLTATDILNQIQSIPESQELTNIVFMGMGEPFDNTDNVLRVLNVLTAETGYAWSPKRVTVSTVGLIPGMLRFLTESQCHLAVSLHNPIAEERLEMMPAQKAFPIARVLEEIKRFDFTGQRRVSFEYTMFEGVNDQQRHVDALVRLLSGLECRVNLIRFHTVPDTPYKGASMQRMEWFRDQLNRKGVTTTIRKSRGEDILAACGLLSTQKISEKSNL
ncbi:MAG: 23S rRNA (adenine(2503)-C(2))-methyltransferase RlmN [Paludibacteraceae bacterium]|nr:23S rRNA (adenine(2503)-C(2))-methyltransferase RlmN [Paludibacteraceae bacterium]MBP5480693.1 23S rRNA (adenine(2503)-C(2))-methyltransferase RlmN [Paludibacteraceae bacterium]